MQLKNTKRARLIDHNLPPRPIAKYTFLDLELTGVA